MKAKIFVISVAVVVTLTIGIVVYAQDSSTIPGENTVMTGGGHRMLGGG